jgi:hypothetical protein
MEKNIEHAMEQGKTQLESIIEMVNALENTGNDGDKREEAEQAIHEDALDVEVRSGWHTPGSENKPEEYMILLCTGGPACRIIGDLSEYGEPENARIEVQDWGTLWTNMQLSSDEEEKVLQYARCFYFGE